MTFAAIIVAAGSGERAGAGTPKQWRLLGGRPVARWSLEALLSAGAEEVLVVVGAGQDDEARAAFEGLPRWRLARGGAARHESVRSGLAALTCGAQIPVLIHDAARPFLSASVVRAVVDAAARSDGAVPALAVADTLKRTQPGDHVSTTSREGLYRAQTPQGFRRAVIEAAYGAWPSGESPTDDAAVVERAGGRVTLTPGDPMLFKLTYPEDFHMAELLAAGARRTHLGSGFDAHRFGPGGSVWLCGCEIPHDHALIGHSDADAGLHAITDAILGAIAEGDIGDHFPPTDPKWRGAPSSLFLEHAAQLVAAKGGRIVNVDVTLICERPKVKPHRAAMRETIARLLGLPLDRVSVKATTTEAMGFTGREEGLAAQAMAAVELPA